MAENGGNRHLSMQFKQFHRHEVSQHSTHSDCWVIVHDDVVDVSDFLQLHPGGVGALAKEGRAGCDVTAHFERIGHSTKARSLLATMKVGTVVLDEFNEHAPLVEKNDFRNHSSNWHAARRRAILIQHPEISNLIGTNPWTCLLGLLTIYIHIKICLFAQLDQVPWYYVIILAYTIGAICKMWQFAICHDICHGTAGTLLERFSILKAISLHIFSLPSLGGVSHGYYAHQHIGHHSSLGAHSLSDLSKEESLLFSPDSDGDLLSIGTLSLGRILLNWEKNLSKEKEEKEEKKTEQMSIQGNDLVKEKQKSNVGFLDMEESYDRVYFHTKTKDYLDYHRQRFLKCLVLQGMHLSHYWTMIFVFLHGLLFPPPISLFTLFCPNKTKQIIEYYKKKNPDKTINNSNMKNKKSKSFQNLLEYYMIEVGPTIALHTWLWFLLFLWLVFSQYSGIDGKGSWTYTSFFKGFLYLHLSELFLYGFGLHPFMGYFLGVHRSGGHGFESEKNKKYDMNNNNDQKNRLLFQIPQELTSSSSSLKEEEKSNPDHHSCQPTMSTYSLLASISSLNLTHHVEHHDFPNIPWNRLPTVTSIAPEFYENLEQSPGFIPTIKRWVDHSDGWGYACQ